MSNQLPIFSKIQINNTKQQEISFQK
jgi:hypothetical protein